MLYQIGDFANMAQISPKKLKYYEQCGLLCPAKVDTLNGYRYYEAEQLRTVAHIRAYLGMGFSTAHIRALLPNGSDGAVFAAQRTKLQAELLETKRRISLLDFYKDALQNGDFNQEYTASLKQTAGGLAAVMRKRFADADAVIQGWQTLRTRLDQCGAVVRPGLYGLTRYHDAEFTMTNMDAELQCLLDKQGAPSPDFTYAMLQPLTAVSVIHRGRYDFMHEAYAFAYLWLDKSGYRPCGKPMESYIAGSYTGVAPVDYLTELLIPIDMEP